MPQPAPPLHGPEHVDHRLLHTFQSELIELLVDKVPHQRVLDTICSKVESVIESSFCSVMVRDPRRGAAFFQAAPSIPNPMQAQFDGLVPGPAAGGCGTAMYTGEMVIVEDATTDERFHCLEKVVQEAGLKACWSIPVHSGEAPNSATFAITRTVTGGPGPAYLELLRLAGHITELVLRQAHQRRQQLADRDIINAAVNEGADCIWSKNAAGVYQFVNAAESRTANHAVPDMLGKSDYDLYPPDQAEIARKSDLEVIETGQPIQYRTEFRAPDGTIRHYHVRKQPRFDQQGEVFEVIGIARDISSEVTSHRALEQSQKLESLGLLAGGIAHDFNNLLVGILGNAEWLLTQQRDAGPVRAAMHDIRNAAERARALTNQMLAYAGQKELDRMPVWVPDLLRDVLGLTKGSLPSTGRVELTFEDHLPPVLGDPTQLRQVFMNLLVNAGDAVRENGGDIDIRAGNFHATASEPIETIQGPLPAGRYLEITVRDHGDGMPEETIQRIFDPFFTTKPSGRGLGLAATRGILAAHGGQIQVASAPGQGSCFRVFLPTDEPNAHPVGDGRPRVLIVDDEPLVRSVAERILNGNGYAVQTARDGAEALEQLRAGPIELLLLDQHLPVRNGSEVLAEVRQTYPDLPVTMLTGGSVSQLADPSVPVLAKPFTAQDLIQAVSSRLSDRPR